jgi:hypothetical protein
VVAPLPPPPPLLLVLLVRPRRVAAEGSGEWEVTSGGERDRTWLLLLLVWLLPDRQRPRRGRQPAVT